MTYRTFEFGWVEGMADTFAPSDEEKARMCRALGWSEWLPLPHALGHGYGGGRNAGAILGSAIANGFDLVLFAEFDITFRARHVVQILEAWKRLHEEHGAVAIGAMYPMSSDPRLQLLATDEGRVSWDLRVPDQRQRLRAAVADAIAHSDDPAFDARFAEVWQLPFGFTLLPVAMFEGAVALAEQGGFNVPAIGFDQAAGAHLRRCGVRQFVDLSLDVGHLASRAISTREALETEE